MQSRTFRAVLKPLSECGLRSGSPYGFARSLAHGSVDLWLHACRTITPAIGHQVLFSPARLRIYGAIELTRIYLATQNAIVTITATTIVSTIAKSQRDANGERTATLLQASLE